MKVSLLEIADFITDGTHGSPERTESGIPVLSAQNVRDGRISYETTRFTTENEYLAFNRRLAIRPGDVLLTIVGSIGRAAVVRESRPAVFQRSVAAIRPKPGKAEPGYLLHLFHSPSFQHELIKNSNQSSQAGVYLGRLGSIEIPLPPLEEQRRIAAILDKAASLRERAKDQLENAKELLASLFVETVGDPLTNPHSWDSIPLSEAVQAGTDVTYGIVQAGEEYPDGVPYIRTGDIVDGEIDVARLRHTDPLIASRFQRSTVRTGEIVMSIRATVGTTAAVPSCLDGANLTQGTARIAPGERLHGAYLLQYLRMPSTQAWIQRQVKGATFREITLARLRELPVLIPAMEVQEVS
jgi:type I restriction enzyme S subunit